MRRMLGVCSTFGWPYCIERSCHENFLSCDSSVVRLLAQTLMLTIIRLYVSPMRQYTDDATAQAPTAYTYPKQTEKQASTLRYFPHSIWNVDLFIYLGIVYRSDFERAICSRWTGRMNAIALYEINSRFTCRIHRIVAVRCQAYRRHRHTHQIHFGISSCVRVYK